MTTNWFQYSVEFVGPVVVKAATKELADSVMSAMTARPVIFLGAYSMAVIDADLFTPGDLATLAANRAILSDQLTGWQADCVAAKAAIAAMRNVGVMYNAQVFDA